MNEQMQPPPQQAAPQQAYPQAPAKSGGGCKKFAIGCGIVLLILVILLAIGGIYVAKNWKSLTASGFSMAINQVVDASSLPDDQKQTIKDRVAHVKEEFLAGNITVEQIGDVYENLDVENLVGAGMAQYVGKGMIGSSKLTDDQKAQGEQAFNRVAHGLIDKQIEIKDVKQALAPVMEDPTSDDWALKQNPTPDDWKQVVDNASKLADQAGVPKDVKEVDFAQQVSDAFDKALGTPQQQP